MRLFIESFWPGFAMMDGPGNICCRTKEGMSKREVIRCLKRYVAREVYSALRQSEGIIAHAA